MKTTMPPMKQVRVPTFGLDPFLTEGIMDMGVNETKVRTNFRAYQ